MDDDNKLVQSVDAARQPPLPTPEIRVTCRLNNGEIRSASFRNTVRIGRDAGCEVRLPTEVVSRQHAQLYFDGTQWRVRDNNSGNGTYLDGHLVSDAALPVKSTLQLGEQGPVIWLEILPIVAPAQTPISASVAPPKPLAAVPQLPPEPHALTISYDLASGEKRTVRFTEKVIIGRDESSDICLKVASVSRRHVEIFPDGLQWKVKNLGSNGTYINGINITEAALPATSTLQIGTDGPTLSLAIEGAPVTRVAPNKPDEIEAPETLTQIVRHYFDASTDHEPGPRTIMVRKAFHEVKKKQSKRHLAMLSVAGILLLTSVGIGVQQYMKLQKSREVAIEMFYTMKTLTLHLSRIESMLEGAESRARRDEIASKRKQLAALEQQYDRFLEESDLLGSRMSEEDRLILRVARIFGECELDMPPGFALEVKRYIAKWKSSDRLKNAIKRMRANNHAQTIQQAMTAVHLPPQFLYLALQESSFNHAAVGPPTRFGIAKGIWQFIPSTARQYGLSTGPLVDLPEYDPDDQRFDFNLATKAAARFIRDIYNTDAQASGLLVMASYNWGPRSILDRIRTMPANPRDRNFWKLLEKHTIPKETYDYVYYIVSAAVIGENPRLFGFDFDNPLATMDEKAVRAVGS